jgi:hypothetical protein
MEWPAQLPGWVGGPLNQASMFFVLRKEPKDFYFFAAPTYPAMTWIFPQAPEAKVFWSFLQKRTYLLHYLIYLPSPAGSSAQSIFRPYRLGQAGRKMLQLYVLASILIRRVTPSGRIML